VRQRMACREFVTQAVFQLQIADALLRRFG
jgi:hypothetical protein